MARKPQSKGACIYCGDEVAKGGMSKHLAACAKRKVIIEQAERKRKAQVNRFITCACKLRGARTFGLIWKCAGRVR